MTDRCPWCGTDPLYVAYHDTEWGVPERDPRALWEKLVLDGFQAGLSWITILRRREGFRDAFADFDPERIARFTEGDVDRLMGDARIIRNRAKLRAARQNAQAWLKLDDPVTWLWSFVGGAPKINHFSDRSQMLAVTPEAEAMSTAPPCDSSRPARRMRRSSTSLPSHSRCAGRAWSTTSKGCV